MKMQIMLCESEPMIENLIREYVTPLGINVISPNQNTQCLEILKKKMPDVIVLDTHMRSNGVGQAVQKIRGMGLTAPIILLGTNYGITSNEDAVGIGANAFIEKPFKLKDFLEQVLNLTQD